MLLMRNFFGNRSWYRVYWNSYGSSRVFDKPKAYRRYPTESRTFSTTEEPIEVIDNPTGDENDPKNDHQDPDETKDDTSMTTTTNPSSHDGFDGVEEEYTNIMTRQEREFRRWKKKLQDLLENEVPQLLEKCTPWIKPSRNHLIKIKCVERSPDGSFPRNFPNPRDQKVVAEFRLEDMLNYWSTPADLSTNDRETIRKRCLLLAGRRYHVRNDLIRMSIDEAGTREANRRLIYQRIHHLMEAAMDSSLPVDSIPWQTVHEQVDQRAPSKTYPFPKQWLDQATALRGNTTNHQKSIDETQPTVLSDTPVSPSPSTNPTRN
jgi:hypothetical protein